MTELDRMELNELRLAMWEVFSRIAKTPTNDHEIEMYVRFMDRHQEIIAGNTREREIKEF